MFKHRAWTALFVFAAFLFWAPPIRAQQSYNVVSVVVEGNRAASESLILGVSSIEIGAPLSPSATAETIRRLYGLDIFSDVQIEAEEVTGGLMVYIVVKELPKLSGLEFQGNKEYKTKELKEKLGLGVGGYISPNLIEKKKNEIKDLYGKKGYFRAEIESRLEYNSDSSEAILTYKVDEKSKVKVAKVIMTGNERVASNDVIKKMRNRKRGFLKSSDFAQDKYEEDQAKVVNEFHKRGYIDAYLISDSMAIDSTINRMTIYLHVYEGPQYYFGTVEFKNNQEMRSERLKSLLKFKEYEIFNIENYDKSLEEIYSAYYDIGHLHIRLLDERTTRADSILDITYDISEGLPSHINLVKIVGNTKTKDKIIRRELSFYPGQKFTRSALIRSVRDVMALNYFAKAEPVPIDLPSGDVDIEFKVEEKQTGQISAGAGYNSQDKLVGNLGLGIPNFRGMGQNLSFNTDFGSRRNSFSISFTEPWMFGRPTLFGADVYILNRRWYDDYTEGRQGGALKLGRRLRWPDNYFRAYLTYRLEGARYYDFDDDFREDNVYKSIHINEEVILVDTTNLVFDTTYTEIARVHSSTPYPGSILQYEEDWNTASRLSFTLTRDSRNLPEFATSGSKVSYTVENTGGLLGGFWDYQKHYLSAAKFVPLFWNIAIAAKVEFGALTTPVKDDSRILLSDRFTPGGTAYDGIVRGYDDGSLTPDSLISQSDTIYYYTDVDTSIFEPGTTPADSFKVVQGSYTRVRGKYMLISNVELQIPLVSQQIYALLFFDAGNSWLRYTDIRPFADMYTSAGFGFRVAVPGIGTIGFDFAYPFQHIRGQDKNWKPHFQIGTTFR